MGRANGIDDFRKIYGDSAESNKLLANGILDMYAKESMTEIKIGTAKNGEPIITHKVDPDKAAAFLHKYRDKLNKVPQIQKALMNKTLTLKMLNERNAVLLNKSKNLKKSKLQELAGGRNPDAVIDEAFKAEDNMTLSVLIKSVEKQGGDVGMDALMSGVARSIMKRDDPLEFVLNNTSKLELLYKNNPQHLQTLTDLAKARRMLEGRHKVSQIDTSLAPKDPYQEKYGTSFREGATLIRHIVSGWISPAYVASHVGSKAVFKIRQQQYNKIMEEALYNPSVADDLLNLAEGVATDPNGKFVNQFADRMSDLMLSLGIKGGIAYVGGDEPLEE
jgi:hypothetical protein